MRLHARKHLLEVKKLEKESIDCIKQHFEINETSIVDRHRCQMAAKFGVFVDEDHSKLPTLYWLPKLH